MRTTDVQSFLAGRTVSTARLDEIADRLEIGFPPRSKKVEKAGLVAQAAVSMPHSFLEILLLAELRLLSAALGSPPSGRTKADYHASILEALDRNDVDQELASPAWVRDRRRNDLEFPVQRGSLPELDISLLPSRPGGLARESLFDIQARLRSPELRRCFFVSYNCSAGLLSRVLTVAFDALAEAAVHRAKLGTITDPAVVVVLDGQKHGIQDTQEGRQLVALARQMPGVVQVRLGPERQVMHAKVYAFEFDDPLSESGVRFETFIGSSNLSHHGMGGVATANIEAAVRIVDGTGWMNFGGSLVRAWLEELVSLTRPLTEQDLGKFETDAGAEALVGYKADFDSPQELILKALAESIAARGREAHPIYELSGLPSIPDHQWVPVVESTSLTTRGFLLFDEVGLGKTVEAGLILSRELRRRRLGEQTDRSKPALIVAPTSLHEQWAEELSNKFGIHAEIFSPGYRQQREREQDLEDGAYWKRTNAKVIITSPGMLRRESAEWPRFDVVLVDECHRAQGAKTFEAIREICDEARLVVFSSGTPVQNRFRDLWYPAVIALPDLIPGESPSEFDAVFGELGEQDVRDLHELLSGSITRAHRVALIESGQIKKRIVNDLRYSLGPHEEFAVTRLQQVREEARGRRGETAAWSFFALEHVLMSSPHAFVNAVTTILRDLPEGFDPEFESDFHRADPGFLALRNSAYLRNELKAVRDKLALALLLTDRPSAKEQKLFEVLEGPDSLDGNVLIFTRFRRTQRRLALILAERYGDAQVRSINGSTGKDDRLAALHWFGQSLDRRTQGPARILVCTDVASEGLNLQAASSTLVNFDLPWNPQRIEQRIGRLQRFGQKRHVHVYNLFGSLQHGKTIDERILEVCREKFNIARDVLGASEMLFTLAEDEMRKLVTGQINDLDWEAQPTLDASATNRVEQIISLPDADHTRRAASIAATRDHAYRKLIQQFWDRSTFGAEDPSLATGYLHDALRAALLQGVVGMIRPAKIERTAVTGASVAAGLRIVLETNIADTAEDDEEDWLIEREVPLLWTDSPHDGVADFRESLLAGGFTIVQESEAATIVGPETVRFLRQLKEDMRLQEADAIPLAECLERAPEPLRTALHNIARNSQRGAAEAVSVCEATWRDEAAKRLLRIERAMTRYQEAGCKEQVLELVGQHSKLARTTLQTRTEILLTQIILIFG